MKMTLRADGLSGRAREARGCDQSGDAHPKKHWHGEGIFTHEPHLHEHSNPLRRRRMCRNCGNRNPCASSVACRLTLPAQRLTAVDALRGLVMVIMALDHTRDFVHISAAVTFSAGGPRTATTPILFFTRWITHFCAPAFMLLRRRRRCLLKLDRDIEAAQLSRFLLDARRLADPA